MPIPNLDFLCAAPLSMVYYSSNGPFLGSEDKIKGVVKLVCDYEQFFCCNIWEAEMFL